MGDTQEELADLQSRFDLLQGDRKGAPPPKPSPATRGGDARWVL
jgi:hypothetical protein